MKLTKLGNFIEQIERRNSDLSFGLDDVRGVANTKGMIYSRANLDGRSFVKFLILNPGEFVFNRRTTRNGERLGMAFNDTNRSYIFTEDYVVFRVKNSCLKQLLPEYLYMLFLRDEFDRYVRFHSWGSATELFSWDEMCNVEIQLPPLAIQQKYVNVYKSLQANQKAYEQGLDDLKTTCDAFIEALRRDMGVQPIGPYIEAKEERNTDLSVTLAQGITNDKYFSTPKQVAAATHNTKIVRKGQFAYNRATTRNGEKISIAYREDEDCIVSSAYQVFEIVKPEGLLPEYLMMWFRRSEFDRYARYKSKGSAHEFFEFDEMCDVRIPIPPLSVQQSIVNIYKVLQTRRKINEQLKEQVKSICPILIKGSLEETERTQVK